jgi:rare lipoprotein A
MGASTVRRAGRTDPLKWSSRLGTAGLAATALIGLGMPGHAADAGTTGMASYYSHAGRTASGAMFDRNAMTAAHRTERFGARLKITNLRNSRSAIVTVTDRGPFIRGRIVDVSARAADILGFRRAGVTRVRVEKAD